MQLRTGSSGYSYKEWKGTFYPATIKPAEMLAWYASRLNTVEINSSFYAMPRASVLAGWSTQVPETFRFSLKAPQRITHRERLKGSAATVAAFWQAAEALGSRLGPLLFQLPPNFKADVPLLEEFLAALPTGARAAFEFRHASWETDRVWSALQERGVAWCVAEEDGDPVPKSPRTADWGYLRLRRTQYEESALAAWYETLQSFGWNEAFVYFKHEDRGEAARLALTFAGLRGSSLTPAT